MLAAGDLVKVPHIEAAIRVPIERQDPLHLERRRLAARGLSASVVEAEGAIGVKPGPPPPEGAGIEVENVGGL